MENGKAEQPAISSGVSAPDPFADMKAAVAKMCKKSRAEGMRRASIIVAAVAKTLNEEAREKIYEALDQVEEEIASGS